MIPDRLIKLRKEAGLTQQKLADILIASINCWFA